MRLAIIIAVAIGAHLLIRAIKAMSERGLAGSDPSDTAARRHPKLATVLSLAVSAATFVLWFVALGLALGTLGVDLTAYFATATVIGLAVGFGSQGLVQDIVIGLTLIFTDALDIGDMVEVSGQVGRVERIGLRFTTLSNFIGQTVYIPNRNISVVGRYRRGVVRTYVDVQVPEDADAAALGGDLQRVVRGFRRQHAAAVVSEPEVLPVQTAEPGDWRFIRIKLRVWPGQQALVESALRQRILARMKSADPAYADWMVPITYRTT